jgi:hypothetical protein
MFDVDAKALPFFSTFAASGTSNTLKPFCVNLKESSVSAVVFPAHGPPVTQILVIVFFLSVGCPLNSESA